MQGKNKLLFILVLVVIFILAMNSNVLGNRKTIPFNVSDSDKGIAQGRTRYISNEYIDTLEENSKWNTSLREELRKSIEKGEGQGMYIIYMSNARLKEIKRSVKNNGYIISRNMNKQLAESW